MKVMIFWGKVQLVEGGSGGVLSVGAKKFGGGMLVL